MNKKSFLFLTLVTLASSLFAASTWDGSSTTDSNWTDSANWVGGNTPGTNADVILTGQSRLNTDANAVWHLNSLTFNSAAGAFTIGGGQINLGAGGLTDQSAAPQWIYNNVNLMANQTWDITNSKGNVTLAGELMNNGYGFTKTGAGSLTLTGSTANTGTGLFTVNQGTVYLDKNNGVNSISGNLLINNTGAVQLETNEQIASSSNVTVNDNGLLKLNGHQETIGSLAGNGTVDVDSGRLTVGANNASTTFSGSITSSNQTGGGLTKIGSGTLTLTGVSSYNGQTIISGGTLALGGNNRLSSASSMVMSGGTFATGGYSQTLGTLTLSANSTIDMGKGSSVLSFSNSSTQGWTAGKSLTINNWSGNLNGGGTDQLRVGVNGLNAAQIAEIQFFDPAGLAPGTYAAKLLSNGEVVPVPEPATIGLGALLFGMVAKRRAKKKQQQKA